MSNGDTPQSPIPPGPDGGCPDGYAYDPSSNQCFLVSPPISVTQTGVSLPDVDPKNAGELDGLGKQDSGIAERFALAYWHTQRRLAKPPVDPNFVPPPKGGGWWHDNIVYAVQEVVNLYDWAVSLGVSFMGDSATRNNPGFWKLVGSVISDLLGVTLDGGTLYSDLQQRGTLPAMRGVGAALVNLLVGEFTGTASGSGGNVTFSSSVNPDTALPTATLTPAGGVAAAQALMGFVLSSAVRQGNLESIGSELGWLGGHVEKFSEAMRTNLGIGRMLRFALRPIFQDLVATPLKWAIYKQYRPTLLNMPEAVRGVNSADVTENDFAELAARAGYNATYITALRRQHTLNPDIKSLLTMHSSGKMVDSDFDLWMRRHGHSSETAALIATASDLEPARRVALALAEHYLVQFGGGVITAQAARNFIDGMKSSGWPLTTGEVAALEALTQSITVTLRLHPRHLTTGQLKQAFIDGTIALDEYEQHLRDLGYSESDVQTLGIEVLIALKKAQAAAAKHAAAGKKGSGPATSPTLAPSTGSTPAIP